jgi:N-acylneuraminate cytidylyltransferase
MNVCIIPARGGSKRIPRKNIKEFNGKPIIAYSIEAALKSNCFDRVIVSTDDNEVAEVAREYGAQVPFIRPDSLSNDYSGTIPVIKHAIEWLERHNNAIENVCCLYATAPFVQPQVISKALQQLQESKADYCFSATSFAFPIQRAVKLTAEKRVDMLYPEFFETRSQDLEEVYHDAGQFYWGKSEAFKEGVLIFSDKSTLYMIPRYFAQDIDTVEDWIMAESMYQFFKKSNALS